MNLRHKVKYFIALAVAVLIAIAATSCGPSYHLKQAKKHIALAGELGAKFRTDTVIIEVPIGGSEFDTTIQFNRIITDGINISTPSGDLGPGPLTIVSEGDIFGEMWNKLFTDTLTVKTKKGSIKLRLDTTARSLSIKEDIRPDTVYVTAPAGTEITIPTGRRDGIMAVIGALIMLALMLALTYIRNQRRA